MVSDQATVCHLTEMMGQEIEAVVAMCVRAYAGDISIKALVGGNWALHEDYWRSVIRAGLLEGEVYGVRNKKGDIVSVGVWFGPGKKAFETEAQRALGFDDFFAKLTPSTQAWWNEICDPTMEQLSKRLWTEQEIKSQWWCINLATDPKYQRRGYATAITNTLYQKAVATSTILGLATAPDENVQKYLGMGFRERGSGPMISPTGNFTVHIFSKD